jgi:hypothetical protein
MDGPLNLTCGLTILFNHALHYTQAKPSSSAGQSNLFPICRGLRDVLQGEKETMALNLLYGKRLHSSVAFGS